jgi:hypothetical protein
MHNQHTPKHRVLSCPRADEKPQTAQRKFSAEAVKVVQVV